MKDEDKTREGLITELAEMRQRVAELEAAETDHQRTEEALRESEQRYRTLFEQKLEGVVVVDETMKVLLANKAAAEMFGFDSAEELAGVNPFDFIPPEEKERVLKVLADDLFGSDLRQVNDFRLINKAGEEVWVSAEGALVEYQGRPVGLASFRDITQRRKTEEELAQKNRELEQKVRELTGLNNMFQQHLKEYFEAEESYKKLVAGIRKMCGGTEELLRQSEKERPRGLLDLEEKR